METAEQALARVGRRDLEAWRKVHDQRDERVRAAKQLGLGVNEIARITGLAKTTVLRILAAPS